MHKRGIKFLEKEKSTKLEKIEFRWDVSLTKRVIATYPPLLMLYPNSVYKNTFFDETCDLYYPTLCKLKIESNYHILNRNIFDK